MKLLIRGGSIAAGHGVTVSYPEIVAKCFVEQRIEVINRSHYRDTSFDGVRTFDEDIDSFRPEVLLIQFGIDDAFQGVYRSEFQENHVQMIKLARRRFNPMIYLATSHTFDDPHDMDAVYIFYWSLRIVAVDLGCELIPVHHFWAGYLKEHGLNHTDLVLPDPMYPNETGHQVIAEAVMRGLNKIIDQTKEIRHSR